MATHAKRSSFSLLVLAFLSLVAISVTGPESDFMDNFSLPSAFKSGMIRLNDDSLNRFISFVLKICSRDDSRDSCQTHLSELTKLSSSLSESRRLAVLNMFLKHSVWRVENAMSVLNEARSGSIGAREDSDLVDCEEMMDVAKDRMVSSLEELRGGSPKLVSHANVHTWLSSVLTRYVTCIEDITTDVSKRRIEPQLKGLISGARVALEIFVSISPMRDVESKMEVPNGFPSWLTDPDKHIDSNPEALKTQATFTVSKDGSGMFTTVKEAVAAAPVNSKTRFVIYVKTGVYAENVYIGKTKTNIAIVGDGKDSTILTGNIYAIPGKIKTYATATLAVEGNGFMAQDICIRNTAGPEKGQAVALRVNADKSIIYRCRIDAFQDTLYAFSDRQFYRSCYITGTVDFIFGRAAAVFQRCQIEARYSRGHTNTNTITAQSRHSPAQKSGFTIQRCNITATPDLAPHKKAVKTYLGRPWDALSTVVVMETFIDDVIDPAGWSPWESDKERLTTLFYGEYRNRGPGADTSRRVGWKGFKIIENPNDAEEFTVRKLLDDSWVNSSGIPYDSGL